MTRGKRAVRNSRVAGGRNEVEERVDTVVAEAGVTLNTRLLGENVVVLTLEVARDLLEAAECVSKRVLLPRIGRGAAGQASRQSSLLLAVDAVTEAGGVDDGEGDANAVLLELDVDGLDGNGTLNVGVGSGLLGENGVDLGARVLGVAQEGLRAVREERLLNKRVDKGGAASAGRAWGMLACCSARRVGVVVGGRRQYSVGRRYARPVHVSGARALPPSTDEPVSRHPHPRYTTRAFRLTNNHDGELDALLGLLPSSRAVSHGYKCRFDA